MFCNFYPTYSNCQTFEYEITKLYSCIHKVCIGKSHLNREINAFLIGNPQNTSVFVGSVHGTEWLTTVLMYKFMDDLCNHYDENSSFCGFDIHKHLNKKGVYIIPCLNPDGVEINLTGSVSAGDYKPLVDSLQKTSCLWNSNVRGVDLNHNFPAKWDMVKENERKYGIFAPANRRFGGTAPLSENETIALTNFCYKHTPRSAYAFHSQGREIYYDFGENTPRESLSMAKSFSEECSYKISTPTGIAVGGGFKDWFIQEFIKPAFTFEIGIGENPLPLGDLEKEYLLLKKALVMATVI